MSGAAVARGSSKGRKGSSSSSSSSQWRSSSSSSSSNTSTSSSSSPSPAAEVPLRGMPYLGVRWQALESAALKRSLGMHSSQSGAAWWRGYEGLKPRHGCFEAKRPKEDTS